MFLTENQALELKSKYDENMLQFAINITERCNMHCSCCYKDSGILDIDITKEIIDRVFNEIAKGPEWCVTITGGEPTLRMDLVKYTIKKAKKNKCMTRLATNGMFSKKVLKQLIRLKIDVVSIGINSFHVFNEDTQRTITAFSNKKVKSLMHINGLEENEISKYIIDPHVFYLRDILTKDGREKVGSSLRLKSTSCSCQGVTVWPDGRLAPFCRKGKNACKFFTFEEWPQYKKYFCKKNRKYYVSEKEDLIPCYCEKNLFEEEVKNGNKEK